MKHPWLSKLSHSSLAKIAAGRHKLAPHANNLLGKKRK